LPSPVLSGVRILGDAAIPMGLLIVGATMADHWVSAGLHRGGLVMLGGCILRLAALPAIFLVMAYFAPFSAGLKRVMIVEAAMPAAVFPIVMSRHYGGDPPTALRVVVATSILGLFTLPLWIRLGLALISG
jgi:predicted permease